MLINVKINLFVKIYLSRSLTKSSKIDFLFIDISLVICGNWEGNLEDESTINSEIDLTKINTSTGGVGTTDVTEDYMTGKGYGISISLDIDYKRSTDTDLYFSPIFIKYRW